MPTINNTSGIILKQSTAYTRSFYFGVTGVSVAVSLSQAGSTTFNKAANSPATEMGNGFYKITLTSSVDTNIAGDLAFNCSTTTSGSTTNFAVWTDQVSGQIVTDISQGCVRQNVAFNNFPFTMTSQGVPAPGFNVTALRNFGSGWSTCTNIPSDQGNGAYFINLSAADLNSPSVALLFTANGADSCLINLITMP